MIKHNKLEEHNLKITNLLQELDYYQNIVFAQNFIIFIASHACSWNNLKEKTNSPIQIHYYSQLLEENSFKNIQNYLSKDYINNYLSDTNHSVFFKINHKFYNQEEQTNNYKIEFYFYEEDKIEKSNIVSFCCLPNQLLNDSLFNNLVFKEENNKKLYEFNYQNIETLFSNILDNKNIKSQYFFELFQEEYPTIHKSQSTSFKI